MDFSLFNPFHKIKCSCLKNFQKLTKNLTFSQNFSLRVSDEIQILPHLLLLLNDLHRLLCLPSLFSHFSCLANLLASSEAQPQSYHPQKGTQNYCNGSFIILFYRIIFRSRNIFIQSFVHFQNITTLTWLTTFIKGPYHLLETDANNYFRCLSLVLLGASCSKCYMSFPRKA